MSAAESVPLRAATAQGLSHGVIVLALAMLMGTQAVTTDLYLPTLPGLAADLGAGMPAVQATITALLLAFGMGQLVAGPLSDRFGRRPVLLGGLALLGGAGCLCALAPGMGWLIAGRALQGLGMAAAMVCARAMVRDLFRPADGARVMSQALTVLGVLAFSSPLLGGALATHWGWRAALWVTAAFGLLCLALVALRLPETLGQLNPRALQLKPMGQTWLRVAAHPGFRAWALLSACTYGGLFAYLAGSSFVLINQLGMSRLGYGMLLATTSATYIVGTFVCRLWLPRHGLQGSVRRAGLITLAGAVGLLAAAGLGWHSPWAIGLPMALFSFAHGVHQPCAQAAVVGPFPDCAGAASALAGFMLSACAVAVGTWLGVALGQTAWPLVYTITFFGVATATVAHTLVRRHGALR